MCTPLRRAILALGLLALEGCEDNPGTAPVNVATVEVTAPADTLTVGRTLQLSALLRDRAGNVLAGRAVTWSSSDTLVARTSAQGLVTGVAPGTVTVTARSEAQANGMALTVKPLPVATVSISPDTSRLVVGQTGQLAATMRDAAGNVLDGREVVWTSSDTVRATVSQTGLVTARAPGTVRVSAASEGKRADASVTVSGTGPPFSGRWTSVSTGPGRTCAVAVGGAAYCWGRNNEGQLGTGDTTSVHAPARIAGGLTWGDVRLGPTATSAPTCGATADAAVWCWGSFQSRGFPTRMPAALGAATTAEYGDLLCAVGTDSVLRCKEYGGGQTYRSIDTVRSFASYPAPCYVTRAGALICLGTSMRNVPRQISDSATILLSVSRGPLYVCALRNDGAVLCTTGYGNGAGGSVSIGGLVEVPGGLRFMQVSGNCGLAADGRVACWSMTFQTSGSNASYTPGTPLYEGGSARFVQISAEPQADGHRCGVTADGQLLCWGNNTYGQLGTGSFGGSFSEPQPVRNPS